MTTTNEKKDDRSLGGTVPDPPETARHVEAPRFTPGPWVVDDSHRRDDGLYIESEGRRDYICALGAEVWDPDEECGMLTPRDDANAQLIAAAPDLYEALKAVMVFMKPGISRGPGVDAWVNALVTAGDALAKVEGR